MKLAWILFVTGMLKFTTPPGAPCTSLELETSFYGGARWQSRNFYANPGRTILKTPGAAGSPDSGYVALSDDDYTVRVSGGQVFRLRAWRGKVPARTWSNYAPMAAGVTTDPWVETCCFLCRAAVADSGCGNARMTKLGRVSFVMAYGDTGRARIRCDVNRWWLRNAKVPCYTCP